MFKGFKATRNPKRHKGRCGSQFQLSQSRNKVEADAFCGKNVRKKLCFTRLEAKKQKVNSNWLSLRIKDSKECMRILFYRLKCIMQGLANLLRAFKAPKSYLTYLEVLKHQESCDCSFLRLSHIENVTRDEYTGRKRLKQNIAHVYRGNLKKPNFS